MSQLTISLEDLTAPMKDLVCLARCEEKLWSARVRMPAEAASAARDAGADPGSATMYKYLLPGCDAEYKKLCKAIRAGKSAHYHMTLPWKEDNSGYRLLLNEKALDYMMELGAYKTEAGQFLEEFLGVYDDAVAKAVQHLGNWGNQRDYPTAEMIRKRFGLSFDFEPMPSTEGFGNMPQGVDKLLAEKLNERNAARMGEAITSAFNQLLEDLEHMRFTLADKDKMKFHASLVTNVARSAKLVFDFNVTGDPAQAAAAEAALKCTQYDFRQLKANMAARDAVVKHAGRAIGQLNNLGFATTADEPVIDDDPPIVIASALA